MNMELVIDAHTHTLASNHAYSTVSENAAAAAQAGLKAIGITDHVPPIEDAPHMLHFQNLHVLPETLCGVRLFRGAELNICDLEGSLYMPEEIMARLDYCIASFHPIMLKPGDSRANTRAYRKAMDCPYVKIIGHPDDGNVPVDFSELVLAAKATDTMLELNNSSLKAAYYRKNTRENLCEMLRLCEKHGVYISLGSDAHFSGAVGRFEESEALLEELRFPRELVASTGLDRFLALLARKKR